MDTNSYYLRMMGIMEWDSKDQGSHQKIMSTMKGHDWQLLEQQIGNCYKCNLCKTRSNVVIGSGDKQSSLLIVGEAPGFHEDQKGLPFVGRAGNLLTNMLLSVGLSREFTYITNIIKCRPPDNRDPLITEIESCTPYLEEQVKLIAPKLILALGRHAAHYLLGNKESMMKLRGVQHVFRDTQIPLIVTYHPAYLLRNPTDKKLAYDDLLQVKALLE